MVHKVAKVFGSIQKFYVRIVWIVAVFLKQKKKEKELTFFLSGKKNPFSESMS